MRGAVCSAAGALRRAVAVAPATSGPRCPPPAVTPRAVGAGALPGPGIAGPFGRHLPPLPLPTPAPAPRGDTSRAVHAARRPQQEVEDEDLLDESTRPRRRLAIKSSPCLLRASCDFASTVFLSTQVESTRFRTADLFCFVLFQNTVNTHSPIETGLTHLLAPLVSFGVSATTMLTPERHKFEVCFPF